LKAHGKKASQKFADIVNNESKGALKVELFGNGVLNQKNWQVMFEQTQSGSNAMAIESLTAFSSLVPELGAEFLQKENCRQRIL
jgi:TRAP-type C4-dicarboxylate transport system substrate-binding protein